MRRIPGGVEAVELGARVESSLDATAGPRILCRHRGRPHALTPPLPLTRTLLIIIIITLLPESRFIPNLNLNSIPNPILKSSPNPNAIPNLLITLALS